MNVVGQLLMLLYAYLLAGGYVCGPWVLGRWAMTHWDQGLDLIQDDDKSAGELMEGSAVYRG
jgi:hypothetical protein